MSSIDLLQPATALSASLASGLFNATELLDRSLARVDKLNPTLNAIVSFDLTRARAAAAASDERRAAGRALGPLDGLPITIKDSISTAGHVTTSGFPPFANHVPAEDAIVVGRLRAAGAVIFGKTNLPPLAGDLQTENTLFGRTANPSATTRGPGGSSGGSAAAVSTGMSALDIGSDIGGSIRNPAHYCGIYGNKPTFELYPKRATFLLRPGTRQQWTWGRWVLSLDQRRICVSFSTHWSHQRPRNGPLESPTPGSRRRRDPWHARRYLGQ